MGKFKQADFEPIEKAPKRHKLFAWVIILTPLLLVAWVAYDAFTAAPQYDISIATVTPLPTMATINNTITQNVTVAEREAPPAPTPDTRIDAIAESAQQQAMNLERLTIRVEAHETRTAVTDTALTQLAADVEQINKVVTVQEYEQAADMQQVIQTGGFVAALLFLSVGGLAVRDLFPKVNTVNTDRKYELPLVNDPVNNGNYDVTPVITPVNEPVITPQSQERFEFIELLGGYFSNSQVARIAARRVNHEDIPEWFRAGVRKMADDKISRTRIAAAVGMTGRYYPVLREVLDS